MESQTPGQKTDAQREDETELRSKGFQDEFDRLVLWLVGIGLFLTILYGASARTCQPDPQQLPAVARAPAERTAPKQVSAPPRQTSAPAQGATQPTTAPAPTVPRPAAAGQPPRAEQQPRANVIFPVRPPCVGEGSGTVGALLALAIAMAALALGTFVGFLFGLPRTLTSSEVRASRQQAASQNVAQGGSPDAAGADAGGAGTGSDVNTNLEKISDWLTTIIVGVGLTKLEDIPRALENFGDRVAPYFSYGGKVFGIAGGLFFLIAGFFLAYVGTRVKLSLVFVWSQRTNQGAATLSVAAQIAPSLNASPVLEADGQAQVSEELKEADRQLLSKSLSQLKTPDEILAWANAKARIGDFASALAGYKDLWGRVPLTEKQQTDYATVLAAAGDTAGAINVVNTMATSGLAPEAEREARQKVAAAAQAGEAAAQDKANLAKLRDGLYSGAYQDSIDAGEALLSRPDQDRDPWVHVWLASAYGQKHAALKAAAQDPPTQTESEALLEMRNKAVAQVKRALELDPKVKQTLQGLYDPRYRVGGDDDLDSLNSDPEIDTILLDKPAEVAPEVQPEAAKSADADDKKSEDGEGPKPVGAG